MVRRIGRPGPGVVVVALGLAFVAITVWWVGADTRLPSRDNAKHLEIAFRYSDALDGGSLLFPFVSWESYPPLVHVVGALGTLVAGQSVATAVITENLVFVPLLLLGIYGTARVACDRRTGLLAVVFALGAPMVMSQFHVFMLDAPAAALAAVSVWLLLASERFARLDVSVLAAVAVAAGFHVKGTFVLFVAGLVAVMLVRGGWRHPRGVAAFAVLALALILPWHLAHLDDMLGLTRGATDGRAIVWYATIPYPSRWTLENFTWYGWSLVNTTLYLPLALFVAAGLGAAGWTVARRRARAGLLPELLGGAAVAYVGVSLINLDDPRYILPALVYGSVLATWWIPRLPRGWSLGATVLLAAVALVNTVTQNLGTGPEIRIPLLAQGEDPIGRGAVTVVSPKGYIEGPPVRDGERPRLVALLAAAGEEGARRVVFDPNALTADRGYDPTVLRLVARQAGLEVPRDGPFTPAPGRVMLTRQPVERVDRPPCVPSGQKGFYLVREGTASTFSCPGDSLGARSSP